MLWLNSRNLKYGQAYEFIHNEKSNGIDIHSVFHLQQAEYKRINYLVNKGMIHEVRSSYAQVQYIDFLHNSIVKCIKKP